MTSHDAPARSTARRLLRLAVVLAVTVAVAPVLGGSAVAAAPSPAAGPIWTMPGNGDLLSAFDRNDYNEQDGAPVQTASPDVPGQQALQITVAGGDQRSEVQPRIPNQHEGDVQYYSYRAYLAPDFPTDAHTWQVVLQWHHASDSGSPPIAIEVRDNRLMLASEGENRQDLGPVQGGESIELVLRIAFSKDPDRGTVDVWNRSDHVLSGYHPPAGTMLDESNYMKLGLYRDTSIDQTGRLWVDDVRVGPSMASVASELQSSPPSEDVNGAPSGSNGGGTSDVIWVAAGMLVLVALFALSTRIRGRGRVRR